MTYIRNPHDPFIWESDGEYDKNHDKQRASPAQATVSAAPSRALLISMATRLRHDFGLLPADAQESLIVQMSQVYEEVAGVGFYNAPVSAAPQEKLDWRWIESVLACDCKNFTHQVCDKCQLLGMIRGLATTKPTAPCPLPSIWRSDEWRKEHALDNRPSEYICADELEAWEASQKEKSCEK